MRFRESDIQPTRDRSLDQVKRAFATGDDARWRHINQKVRYIQSARVLEHQLKKRQS